MLNKEIYSRNIVLSDCISMNIIYKISKIKCHCVKCLNFISDILVAKFNESTQKPIATT